MVKLTIPFVFYGVVGNKSSAKQPDLSPSHVAGVAPRYSALSMPVVLG
jgi:hypothetical protein